MYILQSFVRYNYLQNNLHNVYSNYMIFLFTIRLEVSIFNKGHHQVVRYTKYHRNELNYNAASPSYVRRIFSEKLRIHIILMLYIFPSSA
jgi:hypothetical protein